MDTRTIFNCKVFKVKKKIKSHRHPEGSTVWTAEQSLINFPAIEATRLAKVTYRFLINQSLRLLCIYNNVKREKR